MRDFFWGPSIQLHQLYAREATAKHITQGITPNFHWTDGYFVFYYKQLKHVIAVASVCYLSAIPLTFKETKKKLKKPNNLQNKLTNTKTTTVFFILRKIYFLHINETFATSLRVLGCSISPTTQLIKSFCIHT